MQVEIIEDNNHLEMKIQEFNIIDLIPQREPIIMVGKLLHVGTDSITTTFDVSEHNIFVDNGVFQECGLIENIAQSVAAMNGYFCKINNEKIKLGYIGAVKNLMIYKLPKVNSSIETTVTIVNKVMNVDIIKGVITQENFVIAECEMKIFLDEN